MVDPITVVIFQISQLVNLWNKGRQFTGQQPGNEGSEKDSNDESQLCQFRLNAFIEEKDIGSDKQGKYQESSGVDS